MADFFKNYNKIVLDNGDIMFSRQKDAPFWSTGLNQTVLCGPAVLVTKTHRTWEDVCIPVSKILYLIKEDQEST